MDNRIPVIASACAAAILAGGIGHAQAPHTMPFAPGETLTYEVDWSIFDAGTITVTLGDSDGHKGVSSEIVTTARSQGFSSLLYKVQDDYHSYFNPQTLCSESISKTINEGSRHKQIEIKFDGGRRMAFQDDRDLTRPNMPLKHVENEIPACVEDIVTAFYFLRHQSFQVGHDIHLSINDGGPTREVVAQVQAREQIQTALGNRAAFRVEPKVFGSLYKKKGRLLVWFSDDEQHLPLRIKTSISVGTLTGNLKSVTSHPAAASSAGK